MYFKIVFLFLFLATSFYAYPNKYKEGKWELIKEVDGVTVYSKEVEGSDIKGIKGIFEVPYSCTYTFAVIMDNERALSWVDRMLESTVVTERDPFNHRMYIAMSTPFPFDDREFVYDRKISFDDKEDSIYVKLSSVEHVKKDNGRLRANIYYSEQQFKKIKGGDSCLVTSQTHADPGGYIPSWVVNWYQKDWPVNTSIALKNELQKGPSLIHPDVGGQIDIALETDTTEHVDLKLSSD